MPWATVKVLVLGALVLATSAAGQAVNSSVAAGVGGTQSHLGAAARLTLSRPVTPNLGLGVDLTYATAGVADTGRFCGYAGCSFEAVDLRHALQLSAPVLFWRSGPAPGVKAWVGPYVGRWMACADPFYPPEVQDPRLEPSSSGCVGRVVFDGGIAGGVGIDARIGTRTLGVAVRYAGGVLPSAQLGGGQSERVKVRPALFSVFLTLEREL